MPVRVQLRLLVAASLVAAAVPFTTSSTAAATPCQPWAVQDLATGLGVLENLLPTKHEIYFSGGGVMRFTRGAAPTLLVAADSPGSLRIRNGALYFVTGDGLQSGAFGRADGTIQRFDLRTRKLTTWASGLTMPNGFTFLPDGSALTSRDLAGLNPTGITRVSAKGVVQPMWSNQADSNGMAVDPTGRYVYSDETFTLPSNVYKTEIAHPERRTVLASLGGVKIPPKGLDDLMLSSSGALYVAANSGGEVIRVDPRTGGSCVVASGLTTISSVRQGAGGAFPADHLYATTFTGRIAEIIPPAGVRP